MTMTLEQIEENSQHLLHKWPKDNRIPFPREVLEMLRDLKTKVRLKDKEKAQKTRPLTMENVGTPGEPKPNQTGQIPAQQANATLGTVERLGEGKRQEQLDYVSYYR